MRRTGIAIAIAVLAGVGITAGATSALAHSTASAEHVGVVKRDDTVMFQVPNRDSTPVKAGIQSGTKVLVRCWTLNETVNGSPLWYRIAVDGKTGFTPGGNIQTQPGAPVC